MSIDRKDSEISVIVVEDEPELLEEVATFLSARGMSVRTAARASDLWALLADGWPDAVVLDLGLPDNDGIAVALEMRKTTPEVGIIMVTARGAVHDRVVGYETGADIYLVKPVDLIELTAAIRATARRRGGHATPVPEARPSWSLDLTGWRLISPDQQSIQLTRAEAQVLECLAADPGTAVSRVAIGQRMGKTADLSDHRYVDQVIRRLRRKIEASFDREAPVLSAHNQGYLFSEPITVTAS